MKNKEVIYMLLAMEVREMTNKQRIAFIKAMITWNHTGKMEGMFSLSTTCTVNPFCQARQKDGDSICSHCYAETQQKMYHSLKEKLERNFFILSKVLFSVEDFPVLNCLYFRLEAFGDLYNEIQAMNYIRFAKRNPKVTFALWTKNPFILEKAIETEGKPKNLVIVLSAEKLDIIEPEKKFQQMKERFSFIDKMFFVHGKKAAAENDININCGARNCLTCGRCYTKRTAPIVNELLK